MLNHYVPRFYLKGFRCPGSENQVWVFDKEKQRFFRASVARVGAAHGFYDDDVEARLNQHVEAPGNAVLQAVRARETITPDQKARLALYIGVLMMRVPEKRRRAFEMVPGVVDETITQAYREIQALGVESGAPNELVQRRLTEVEGFRETFEKHPPQGLLEAIHSPWPSKNVVSAVFSMRWRFGVASGPSSFLTSDNPVFFFRSYGVGRAESELTFAISSELVLLGDRQGVQTAPPEYLELPESYVKEANRRVASEATRFIFYRARPAWIPVVANKVNPYLSRILWGDA